jgi:hypothetical protein
MDDDFKFDQRSSSLTKSLKFLKVKSFNCAVGFELSNLEVLYFCKRIQIDIVSYPNLKQIHFFNHRKDEYFNDGEREQILIELFRQKQNLRNDQLKIWYEGMLCDAEETIRETIERFKSQFGSLFNYRNYEFYKMNDEKFNFKLIQKLL